MKNLIVVTLVLFSLKTLAFNEVECAGRNTEGQRVDFEIEESWGGSIHDALLVVYSGGTEGPEETRYRLYNTRPQNRRILYTGQDGVRLEVDLFPDRVPQWGRSYRGQLQVPATQVGSVSCRFPQVRP